MSLDISVVCDKDKLDDRGCKGAPDMIVEILSPSTIRHDMIYKMRRYQQTGVKEYWIVSPNEQTIQVFILDSGYKLMEAYTKDALAKVIVLQGCFIELSKVFDE